MATSEIKLNKLYIDKAKKDLHEKPDHIDANIKSLRRCIESMPHLTCPDDDRFYLAFLRQAKYEHAKAQARIDNFITLRCSEKHPTSNWFNYSELNPAVVDEYFRIGIHAPVGFLEDGTFLFIVRPAKWNEEKLKTNILIKFMLLQIDRLLEDPRIQIAGIRLLFDLTGISSSHITAMNSRKNSKEMIKIFQEAYPLRVKSFIYYNEPTIMDVIFKIMTIWFRPKLKERILRVKGDINKACKKIHGLRSVLPGEYGGDNKSIEQFIEKSNEELLLYLRGPRLWANVRVDESKRPESAKNYIEEYKDYAEHSMGISGTYIELPVND